MISLLQEMILIYMITVLKNLLDVQFSITDLEEMNYYLGLEVTRIKDGIFLSREVCTGFIKICKND